MEIKDCAAIVTGGASGMGKATAQTLARLGAKVTLLDVNIAAAEQVADVIKGYAIYCDITKADSAEEAILKAQQTHGPARIYVNCAGIVNSRRTVNQQGPMPLEEFRKIIEINLIGTFNIMRLAAAAMIPLPPQGPSEERGIIINTTSIAAFEGQIGQVAYSASKGGVASMTLPAAREFAQFGIRVMAIAPGLVDTPMFGSLSAEAKSSLAASVPFPKRLARPEEYAALVHHIIENAMLNGEVIRLDGALRMQPK